jgi:hypothetical protein
LYSEFVLTNYLLPAISQKITVKNSWAWIAVVALLALWSLGAMYLCRQSGANFTWGVSWQNAFQAGITCGR